MKKSASKNIIPDTIEFTDEDGKKWIQTSTDDLFSMQELNDILESIDKGIESDDIVLARIDFQQVNKEYYDAAINLHKKLRKQTELLRKVIADSKIKIERKNKKLKELIEYIKKLHFFLAHINISDEELEKLKMPSDLLLQTLISHKDVPKAKTVSVYEDVEELELSLD